MTKFLNQNEMLALYASTREELISLGHEPFVTDVERMYREYHEQNGYISCDHSTKDLNLGLKMRFLQLMSSTDPKSIGFWQIGWCSTCLGHHPEYPFHLEMVRNSK